MIDYFKCVDDFNNIIGIFKATSPKNAADLALTKLIQTNKLQPNTSMNFTIVEYIKCNTKSKYYFKGTRTELENKISVKISGSDDVMIVDNVSATIELPKFEYDEDNCIVIDINTVQNIDIIKCKNVSLKL